MRTPDRLSNCLPGSAGELAAIAANDIYFQRPTGHEGAFEEARDGKEVEELTEVFGSWGPLVLEIWINSR